MTAWKQFLVKLRYKKYLTVINKVAVNKLILFKETDKIMVIC